jgi:hypothetical protein
VESEVGGKGGKGIDRDGSREGRIERWRERGKEKRFMYE